MILMNAEFAIPCSNDATMENAGQLAPPILVCGMGFLQRPCHPRNHPGTQEPPVVRWSTVVPAKAVPRPARGSHWREGAADTVLQRCLCPGCVSREGSAAVFSPFVAFGFDHASVRGRTLFWKALATGSSPDDAAR